MTVRELGVALSERLDDGDNGATVGPDVDVEGMLLSRLVNARAVNGPKDIVETLRLVELVPPLGSVRLLALRVAEGVTMAGTITFWTADPLVANTVTLNVPVATEPTVRVDVAVPFAFNVSVVGAKVIDGPAGDEKADSVKFPANPAKLVAVTLADPKEPTVNDRMLGLAVRTKFGLVTLIRTRLESTVLPLVPVTVAK